jgi:hypothetical protein
MSDWDAGDTNYDAGHESADLDHTTTIHSNEHDAGQQYQAYGTEHNAETDQHYANGHHVEYDTPQSHYSETDYTNYDTHAETHDAAYGEASNNFEHDANFGNLDQLHESFDADQISFQHEAPSLAGK